MLGGGGLGHLELDTTILTKRESPFRGVCLLVLKLCRFTCGFRRLFVFTYLESA